MILGIPLKSALLFFISIAAIEGTIQLYYSIYWGSMMNLFLVLSGLSSLYMGGNVRAVASYRRITLYIWSASMAVGLGLGFYFIFNGRELLKSWCLALLPGEDGAACSESSLTSAYVGFVCAGFGFGLPFMYVAVETVRLLYMEALEESKSL
ncbi:hypothetical protein ACHAWF_018887 [Thalassiosira exigua]